MSLIRMIDIVIGNEPEMDFKIDMYEENIKPIADYLKNVQARLQAIDIKDAWKVAALIRNVTFKWETFHDMWCKGKPNKVHKYRLKKEKLAEKAASQQNGT